MCFALGFIYFYLYGLDDILYDPLFSTFIIHVHQLLPVCFKGILLNHNLFVIRRVVSLVLASSVFFYIGIKHYMWHTSQSNIVGCFSKYLYGIYHMRAVEVFYQLTLTSHKIHYHCSQCSNMVQATMQLPLPYFSLTFYILNHLFENCWCAKPFQGYI